jgi:polyisoprenoid-binding protein YceI
MSKSVLWFIAAAFAGIAAVARSAPAAYLIEPTHTVVSFEVRNLGFARQRGLFDAVSGKVSLDSQAHTGSVDIVVDAKSVQTDNAAASAFLRGQSFLDVERFTQIVYRAGQVIYEQGQPVRIEGELTLLGVTRAVSLAVSNFQCRADAVGATRCVLEAAASFKRSQFGMNRFLTLVSDDVRLAVHGVTNEDL